MSKTILHKAEARERIYAGVKALADVVAVTMGPKGRNVIVGKTFGNPTITKDGVSVAKEVVLDDYIENMGAQLVKEVAGRTADVAGDGTTTSTVLAAEILKKGMELMETGYSPLDFRDAMDIITKQVVTRLSFLTTPINNTKDLENIATISANNDRALGSSIAEAFEAVNWTGPVTAEAVPGVETFVRYIDGIELKSGFISSAFLAGETGSNCTFENCRILICDKELSNVESLLPILNQLHTEDQSVLIIAKTVKQEALVTLIENKKLGRLKSVAIEIPSFSGKKREWLEDLSALVGTHIVNDEEGLSLSKLSLSDLGFADKIVVDKYSTKILGGRKDAERVEYRKGVYEKDLKKLLSESERLDIKTRLGFLSSRAAILSVGYSTELELREKGDRVDDALSATKAAVEEGILAGGGVSLLKALQYVLEESCFDEKYRPVASCIFEASKKPLAQMLYNAGKNEEEINNIISDVLKSSKLGYGYDVAGDSFCNLLDKGIIDPKKVTRTAFQNAVSIASLIITTEALLADRPDNPSGYQPPATYRLPDNKNLNHKY
jgi:chaperonin GroEL